MRNRLGRRLPWTRPGSDLESRLVWIFGSPRSGSTWLWGMLGAGYRTLRIDEPSIGIHLAVLLAGHTSLRTASTRTGELTLNRARADSRSYFFSSAFEDVWRPLLRELLLGRLAPEVVELATAAKTANPRVLIKEPDGSQAADVIMSALRRARMVFLLRDGRDVIDSELDAFAAGGWAARTVPGLLPSDRDRDGFIRDRAAAWLARTEACERAYAAHPPELRAMVRYEDLLADTERRLRELVLGLELDLDPSAIPGVVERWDRGRIAADERGSGRFARAARPGLWRENLSASEQDLVESLIGPKLRELGYGGAR